MSYVDMMGSVRWTEQQHVERVEAEVRSQVTHVREHVMLRRTIALIFYILAQLLPDGPLKAMVAAFGRPLSPAALAELTAAAAVFLAADDLAAQAREDAALLGRALDYEEAQDALAALPLPPEEGEDPHAEARQALQAALAAADADTLALVYVRPRALALAAHPPEEIAP